MIKYSDQMRYQKYNVKKKRKGRKKKTIKYCLDILTFDIEVSSAWMSKDGLIGYTPGHDADYWNDMDKYSLPYIWQFGFNDTIYYDRDIRKFLHVLDDLPGEVLYIIWIHNLAYEFAAALLNILTVEKLFARSPHAPMYVIFEEYPNIRFQCSYILTNMSLKTWGDQLGIPKLVGDLDYTKLRTPLTELTDEEMAYCERDCIVVYNGILDHLKTYDTVFDIPMTSTGKVRRPVKELVTNDKKYMREIKRLVPESVEDYERQQSVFSGGYTHGNRKYLDQIITAEEYGFMGHADIASSYPTQMMGKLPYNKWCYYGKDLPDPKTFEYRAYIIKLHLVGVEVKTWNTYISASKCRGKKILQDNGRVLCAEELWLNCTEMDYLTILETYSFKDIESEGTYVCHKRYLPTILIDFMLKLYEDKTSLKGIDEDRYKISKQYINSLYGMMVTNIIQSDVTFDNNVWNVEELSFDMIDRRLKKMDRWFDKSYFVNYSSGCWITAGARRSLWTAILHGDMDNRLLYCDTDSLFYIGHEDFTYYNNEVDRRLKEACDYHGIDFKRTRPKDRFGVEHPLGHMEIENPDQTLEKFKTMGAKKYCEQRDGKLYLTVSGVNKAAVSSLNGDISNFCDGWEFDKDHPDVHKNEITYLDNMKPVTWPDGYKSYFKFGINMRPTGYRLSVPNVYDRLDNLLEQLLNPSTEHIIARRGRRLK